MVLVGPLPPPYNGNTIAFEWLVREAQSWGRSVHTVDLSWAARRWPSPSFKILLVPKYLVLVVRGFCAIALARGVVYLTVAQSKRGFARDAAFIWCSHLFRRRIVVHVHGGNYGQFYESCGTLLRQTIRGTLLRTDTIVILGESLRGMFEFEERLKERVVVVPNGVPIAHGTLDECKKIPEQQLGDIEILYLSNLIESKGYLDVLEAVAILQSNRIFNCVKCHFCGEFIDENGNTQSGVVAEAKRYFVERIAALGLGNNVVYHGTVTGNEKHNLLKRCHFLILPTRYKNEGQPIAILEAMAHGSVVISTPHRSIPDMIEDGVTGFLVEQAEPARIAKAVCRAVQDVGLWQRIRRSAWEKCRTEYSLETHLERMRTLLCGNGNRSGAPYCKGSD
jgi:glycosyltransferase involved in cell wall biosynthesis